MRDAEHFNCPGCALQLYIMSKMNCYIAPNHHPCQLTMVVMEAETWETNGHIMDYFFSFRP